MIVILRSNLSAIFELLDVKLDLSRHMLPHMCRSQVCLSQ